MPKLIRLLPAEVDVENLLQDLQQAGISLEQVQIVSDDRSARTLLGCDPVCTLRRYGLIGTLIGGGTYTIFAAIAAYCECALFGFGISIGLGVFLGGVLAGAFVGGLLGLLVGLGLYEEADYRYMDALRGGGQVLVVNTSRQEAPHVQHLLEQKQALIVKPAA